MLVRIIIFISAIAAFLFLPGLLNGQNYITIKIVDAETKEILIGATALNLDSGDGTITDNSGYLRIINDGSNSIISFSYLGYFQKNYAIDALPKIVKLERNTNSLSEITIVSERIPQALTLDKETIVDFVMDGDKIIMLSKKKGKDFVLKLTDLEGMHIFTQALPDLKHVQELYTSCFGTHFLVGEYEVLQLKSTLDTITIVERAERKLFDAFILPCKTQNQDYIFFEEKSVRGQIASIYAYSRVGKERFLFAGVADEGNLKRYASDRPYMDYIDGKGPLHLGIHASHSKDPRTNAKSAVQWGILLKQSFYLPVDFFMMCHDDKVLLFDHEKCTMKIFDESGAVEKETPIHYPKQKGWKSKDNMIIDRITNKLYAVHKTGNHKYFTEIDLRSGKSLHKYRIKAPFVENISIHDGNVYFTNSSVVPGKGARILKKVELH